MKEYEKYTKKELIERLEELEKESIDNEQVFENLVVFINEVHNKNYNARFVWPQDITEQIVAHIAIQDAIDSFNGFYVDEERWLDKEAIAVLKAADCFDRKQDIRIEALTSFLYSWNKIEKMLEAANFGTFCKSKVVKDIWNKMTKIESEGVDFITNENDNITKTVVVDNYFVLEVYNYADTGLEFTIYFAPISGESMSYDWPEDERNLYKNNKTEWPEFMTDDSFEILAKEICAIRESSKDSDGPYMKYLKKDSKLGRVVDFIYDFFVINDTSMPVTASAIKDIVANVFRKGFEIKDYGLGESWYFLAGGQTKSQYLCCILKECGDEDGTILVIVKLNEDWRGYYSESEFISY